MGVAASYDILPERTGLWNQGMESFGWPNNFVERISFRSNGLKSVLQRVLSGTVYLTYLLAKHPTHEVFLAFSDGRCGLATRAGRRQTEAAVDSVGLVV
jgi:hypothetical protein